jgi:hypothetical protein
MTVNYSNNTLEVMAYCPAEMVKRIDRAAVSEGISRSAFVRRALIFEMRRIDLENNPGNAAKLNPGPVDGTEELNTHDRTK